MVAGGCSAPGGPTSGTRWNNGSTSGQQTTDAGVDTLAVIKPSGLCTTPRASEVLPPRVDLMGMAPPPMTGAPPPKQVIQTSDLYLRFHTSCGQCHADGQTNGGLTTSAATFATDVDGVWLASIMSNDPNKAMPPEMKAYKDRPASDPVVQLATYLQAWIMAGRPRDSFAIDAATDTMPTGTGTYDYSFSSGMAESMSNLGTCIPDKASYANSSSTEMESKDAMFAAATQLPPTLSATDLVTFDSSVLAANGVIAYVPTYPLWSDGSAKVRYIRVPKGTSVKFDKETQTFDIPPNTRFYKTFLRKVKDIAGREAYRKIETRLIVARPDQIGPDGVTVEQTALFGTYVWNDEETEAVLHTRPNRDGKSFSDLTTTYVTDELLYSTVVDSVSTGSSGGFEARLDQVLLSDYSGNVDHPGLREHYAIPGQIRCNQCHMGSPSKNFVLGFFPLQVARQPDGQVGTYEPTGADELTQLQRLIDYGLITGMDSPADVIALEQSQAPRHARTIQELAAQAYMVGNCAHCHNPRGFPSITKPELAPVLNFMPGRGQDGGGIFEFPLTRISPVRTRGANRDIPIPYITPSLRDYPVTDADLYRLDSPNVLIGPEGGGEKTWSPKYFPAAEGSGFTTTDASGKPLPLGIKTRAEAPGCALAGAEGALKAFCGDRTTGHTFVPAPWRSLIYRNVDAPFPYFDDYVPLPHMPMNTAGYDYRAPRLMGDWMVSIPAVRVDQSQELGHGEDDLPSHFAVSHDGSYDDSPQPYVEVKPGDPRYGEGLLGARARLEEYHKGIRYNYREEALGDDILDQIRDSLGNLPDADAILPDPNRYLIGGIPPQVGGQVAFPSIGVPYHSHWFDYDPTDNNGNWQPRRGTAWMGVLLDGVPDDSLSDDLRLAHALTRDDPRWMAEMAARAATTAALTKAELTESLKKFATTSVPFGVWKVQPECQAKLAPMPKVSAFSQTPNPPWWMTKDTTKPAPDSPVYMMSPGQALYRHICFNCHGPKADGKGLQGDALAAASDGRARPANFVAGLFGPVDQPGDNLRRVFGGTDQQALDLAGVTTAAERLGSRYMAWMALGGTLQHIPLDIINQVEATRILGEKRPNLPSLADNATVSANMLNLAKGLCSIVLPAGIGPQGRANAPSSRFTFRGLSSVVWPQDGYPLFAQEDYAPFVRSTGDWEMWVHLCNDFSPPVVRVYSVYKNEDTYSVGLGGGGLFGQGTPRYAGLIYADSYPATDVWDQDQQVQHNGVDPKTNLYPACFMRPVPEDTEQGADKTPFAELFLSQSHMPICPDEFLAKGKRLTEEDANLWVLNGAITAGMSVFSYLRDPNTDLAHKAPPPYYDECQLLP